MAYCTVADVKQYLGITEDGDDVHIDTLINAAQAEIDAFTSQTFEASADTTRYFDAIGPHVDARTLRLGAPLCAITTVTNGNSVAVTSAQYTTRPRNETPYYAIRILSNSGIVWTYTDEWMDAIEITGRWAYSTTAPADIKQACIRLVGYLYRQKDAQMYDVTAIEAGVVVRPFGFPPDVRAILGPYKRYL